MLNIKKQRFYLSLCLFILTFIAYYNLKDNGFIRTYDDAQYIIDNKPIQDGLSITNIKWAFSTFYSSNYHPFTWISLMTDIHVFGINPGAIHLHNLLLHMLNTVMIFLILSIATNSILPSFLVAAMFAIHPTHVESVAWAAERKDVLSTFFCLLAIIFWYEYIKRNKFNFIFYISALAMFLFSLLSKQTYVTLPFLLLILEFWPFKRSIQIFQLFNNKIELKKRLYLILDKIPLIIMSVVFSIIIYIAQDTGGYTSTITKKFPLVYILYNTSLSYFRYIGSTIYPFDLSIMYPIIFKYNNASTILCYSTLALATIIVYLKKDKFPYLFIGVLWYLGTLVPVIGYVNIGFHTHADRYTYFPTIGLYIIFFWSIYHVLKKKNLKHTKAFVIMFITIVFSIFTYNTVKYLKLWKNDYTIYKNALKLNQNNPPILNNMGLLYQKRGDLDKALVYYKKSYKLFKTNYKICINIGNIYNNKKSYKKALKFYKKSYKIVPNHPKVNHLLSVVYINTDSLNKALKHHDKMMKYETEYKAEFINNFANKLLNNNYIDQADSILTKNISKYPQVLNLHLNYLKTKIIKNNIKEAINHSNRIINRVNNKTLLYNISTLFFEKQKYEASIEILKQNWDGKMESKVDTLIDKRIKKLELKY